MHKKNLNINIFSFLMFFAIMLNALSDESIALANTNVYDGVYFETRGITEEDRSYFADNIEGLAKSISMTFDIYSDQIVFGSFLPVRGVENMYYIPVFEENNCICVVTYIRQDNEAGFNYSVNIAGYINSLNNGLYYFEKYNENIYIVGDECYYLVETVIDAEDCSTGPLFNPDLSCDSVNAFVGIQTAQLTGQARDVSSRSLNVPYYENGGRYCWLACCASIIQYFGYTPASLSSLHAYGHSDHSLENCSGGSIYDAVSNTLSRAAGIQGVIKGSRLSAGTVQSQINAGKPIYTYWEHADDILYWYSSHAMVICGYTYVDNTHAFTYKLRDPNISDYVYIYSNTSATQITYTISGYAYTWTDSYYNLHGVFE